MTLIENDKCISENFNFNYINYICIIVTNYNDNFNYIKFTVCLVIDHHFVYGAFSNR